MRIETLVEYLDDADQAAEWLRESGLTNPQRAHRNLLNLAELGITLDLLVSLCQQLRKQLPDLSDPDMALNNLERFFSASRSPLALASLVERDDQALPILLQIFSTSQFLSDLLIRDPESFDVVRLTDGQPVARDVLVDEIVSDVRARHDRDDIIRALRTHKLRETLRIAFGDIVRRQRIETVTEQISFVADAICQAAVDAARRELEAKRGEPTTPRGTPARFVVLALGKLGGVELNYSSDIDLIFLCESDGKTRHQRPMSNAEFFQRMARLVVKMLTESTDLGVAYRVDLRLRPQGKQGPVVMDADAAWRHYDLAGRTWERQAFVKARPIAGDLSLGNEFLNQLQDWVFRCYLSRADITGIKALKRRIEHRADRDGTGRDVKTGHGGIRDVEFVIQFLQLLNGAELPRIRTGNTLEAIGRLEEARCLQLEERTILEENYAFLRKIEHRLQIMFDLQTHAMPTSTVELTRLAKRMGYAERNGASVLEQFERDFRTRTDQNRKILDHLLHDAFPDDADAHPATDLVLDPDPAAETIERDLGPFGFENIPAAYRNLTALASEKIPFLSTRRCRHFLAAIAPKLLATIARTPNPDLTLVNLSNISESLGGKGVLWELFSFHPPSLDLYVGLCASSSYLSGILTSNPGMIDELMDSLVLDKLPSISSLRHLLDDLCQGAADVEPILIGFKNAQHLRVGVRDILGKEDIRTTHRALSDIAEVLLGEIARRQYERTVEKYGTPIIAEGARRGEPCQLMVLALGKLGGREPNYHSDLDLIFLYEADGTTEATSRHQQETTNQHFFSQLGQRIIKFVNRLGPNGRLYELDTRLRPTGKSGALAANLAEFARYFQSGQGQLWERLALCKARVITGHDRTRNEAAAVVRAVVTQGWQPRFANEIRQMRYRLEENAGPRNLKRARGGTVDVEFAIQMLQLRHGRDDPQVLQPGTFDAIAALRETGALRQEDADGLAHSYRFLRTVESRLRLMNATARHDVPIDEHERKGLAFLLDYDDPRRLESDCDTVMRDTRRRFERIFARA